MDNFNRTGPGLGANWVGSGPTIVGNQLVGGADASIFWQPAFGTDQYASVKIIQLNGCDGIGLLLKASGNTPASGLVFVGYNRCGYPKISIYGYNPTWGGYAPFGGGNVPTFTPGDVLSARMQANGLVSVFYNSTLVASATLDAGNAGFDTGRPGQIGLTTSSSAVIVDDFNGGTQ